MNKIRKKKVGNCLSLVGGRSDLVNLLINKYKFHEKKKCLCFKINVQGTFKIP